jgi:hypothetical protein
MSRKSRADKKRQQKFEEALKRGDIQLAEKQIGETTLTEDDIKEMLYEAKPWKKIKEKSSIIEEMEDAIPIILNKRKVEKVSDKNEINEIESTFEKPVDENLIEEIKDIEMPFDEEEPDLTKCQTITFLNNDISPILNEFMRMNLYIEIKTSRQITIAPEETIEEELSFKEELIK